MVSATQKVQQSLSSRIIGYTKATELRNSTGKEYSIRTDWMSVI